MVEQALAACRMWRNLGQPDGGFRRLKPGKRKVERRRNCLTANASADEPSRA
jgi:hypothetical protein